MAEGPKKLDERVAALETAVANVISTVERMASSNQTSMEAIFRKLDVQGKPNLTLFVSVLGLVFMIMAGLGGLFALPFKDELIRQKEASSTVESRAKEALGGLEARTTKELEKLDERLQREYSLVNSEIKSRIDNANAGWLQHYDRNRSEIDRLAKFQDQALQEGLRRILKDPEEQSHGRRKKQP